MARTEHSPSNELLAAAKIHASNVLGIPEHCFFPRWRVDGTQLWLEASSGSRIMTVDFVQGEITFSSRTLSGRVDALPNAWRVEMMKFVDGSYATEELRERMDARYARHNAEREQHGFRKAMEMRAAEHAALADTVNDWSEQYEHGGWAHDGFDCSYDECRGEDEED